MAALTEVDYERSLRHGIDGVFRPEFAQGRERGHRLEEALFDVGIQATVPTHDEKGRR